MTSLLETPLPDLMAKAAAIRDAAWGRAISFSKKVFVPLTQACRDSCGYCTFAQPPGARVYMTADEVLAIARRGRAAGCNEVLFTLGDKPEMRWPRARAELTTLGHATTLDYLHAIAGLVLRETGLLPHINAGVMDRDAITALRGVSVSQGLMLESTAERLLRRGGAHAGAPDKRPALRLAMIENAGAARVPFTTGILIGIGETRAERIDALRAIAVAHARHGHIQEVIVQNFRAKPGTRMADAPEPTLDDLLWTIAAARLILPPAVALQAPPNLSGEFGRLIAAGINDWGGVSPVTPDHVNPEAPWPHLDRLRQVTENEGFELIERLAVYPRFAGAAWLEPHLATNVLHRIDATGYVRDDDWRTGKPGAPPALPAPAIAPAPIAGPWTEPKVAALFESRGRDLARVIAAADETRRAVNGETVGFVVNRNINYTNICYFRCGFCAFSKGKLAANLRGPAYDLALDEIVRRAREAWARGATEVCLQGGIHPDYTGRTYLDICRAIKAALPAMHIHAFSPLEIWHGATTMGMPVGDFLAELKRAGLGSLPGTAAEILDDEIRDVLCPDKVSTAQWLDIMRAAHRAGLKTTATIMFGHVDGPVNWARHLLRVRALQEDSGGFTEFVPLPFVAEEAPIFLKGRARPGPTYREAIAMHAVARLVLHPVIANIQTSWVKMGPDGAIAALRAGANDLGGTLMNESITRAAGAAHGEEMSPAAMAALIARAGRMPRVRTTIYGDAPEERIAAARLAAPLEPIVATPARERARARTRLPKPREAA